MSIRKAGKSVGYGTPIPPKLSIVMNDFGNQFFNRILSKIDYYSQKIIDFLSKFDYYSKIIDFCQKSIFSVKIIEFCPKSIFFVENFASVQTCVCSSSLATCAIVFDLRPLTWELRAHGSGRWRWLESFCDTAEAMLECLLYVYTQEGTANEGHCE